MKAIAAPGYGPLERLAVMDVPLPIPGAGEVRVRVVASALNPADYKVVLGTLKFLHARNRPLIVGYDFSGTVDAVGSVGHAACRSATTSSASCPYGPGNRRGAFAESLIARSDEIALKPAGRLPRARRPPPRRRGSRRIQSIRESRAPARGGRPRSLVTGVSGGVGSIARRHREEARTRP